MRRTAVLVSFAAALILAPASAATFLPIRRTSGEVTLPRVRAGVVKIPSGHASGRVTVLVDLQLAPLAASARTILGFGASRRLNVASASSRAYLAQLAKAQQAAAAKLRRAIPEARIYRRYRILLDGFAVQLPARRLPALARLSFVAKVYPSLRYELNLNRSPAIIGATALRDATGADGTGVKIGIVDDGVDMDNPFFDPTGFSYPPGFPKGGRKWTTPKVIVARSFPPPGFGPPSNRALDRRTSFHGTHVAGIAAGDAGTNAPAGPDHPAVSGLSGVAPRAWIGNYRVFNRPTPIGNDAFTPEIVAAFESAVRDGMDVINFSGGGPQVDPASDALVEAVRNVANAGVVPVIAAGNDRDDFGFGSVGTPGTAPDAITVAAVSNSHVFAPVLSVDSANAPPSVKGIPFQSNGTVPSAWTSSAQTLVDVGSIVGLDGNPVDRHLCGPPSDPEARGSLPSGSLSGLIALVFRGGCTFVSKVARARLGGAIGIVLVDNRAGEADPIPVALGLPAGMISDLDGSRVLSTLQGTGGRAPITVTTSPAELGTGRSGVVTSFSSAGPTAFGHALKPDVAAPGGQILSSTLPEYANSPFAVFDGTSMATPHVTGAAALLVQRHRSWSPQQIKSALVETAGPAWVDTTRTAEAPVTLEGGGLVNVATADNPKIFSDPASLSFGDLNVNRGAKQRSALLTLTDAGGGGGNWTIELQAQSGSSGATLNVPSVVAVPPGGATTVAVTAVASTDAAAGDDYGFLVLKRGSDVRRVPYLFFVTRPALEGAPVTPLKLYQRGTTASGTNRTNVYRFPTAPFGRLDISFGGPPMQEDGAEHIYEFHVDSPTANFGAAVVASSTNAVIDPWVLGSLDENDVQGYAGTPANVNVLTFGYRLDAEAAGAVFPREKRYYIAVDSGQNRFTNRSLAGRYLLRAWVNDVTPPRVRLLTRRVTAGRPMIAARVTDAGAGVDPLSLVIAYRRVLVGAAFYDPFSGIALFPLPRAAPTIPKGKTSAVVVASDYQEAKNVDQAGARVLPNTNYRPVKVTGVTKPTVTWLLPDARFCIRKQTRLVVTASAPKKITAVRFFVGSKPIATVKRGVAGLYATDWRTGRTKPGLHTLRAVVIDSGAAKGSAGKLVRVCR